jgi:hypothetical protein
VLHGRGGKGRLVIHYSDLDSLDGVLERLRTAPSNRFPALECGPHAPPSSASRSCRNAGAMASSSITP